MDVPAAVMRGKRTGVRPTPRAKQRVAVMIDLERFSSQRDIDYRYIYSGVGWLCFGEGQSGGGEGGGQYRCIRSYPDNKQIWGMNPI